MIKNIKRAITIAIIIIIITIAIISTFFIIKYCIKKSKINSIIDTYSDATVQIRLQNQNNENAIKDNMLLQLDGESVIGVIKIEKINFEGIIYEGTSLDTLEKGIGHFENSPYMNGNACFAGHNTNQFWAKLHTLKNGDKITYISFLGTKEYQVNNIKEISETDWTLLKNTDENLVTLITCIKDKPFKRLCVQAKEIN